MEKRRKTDLFEFNLCIGTAVALSILASDKIVTLTQDIVTTTIGEFLIRCIVMFLLVVSASLAYEHWRKRSAKKRKNSNQV